MSIFYQCKLCKILVPSESDICSHLRKKHEVYSTNDQEDQGWEEVLFKDLAVLAVRLTEDDVYEATTPLTLADIQPQQISSSTSSSSTSTPTITTSSRGRPIKKRKLSDADDEETSDQELEDEPDKPDKHKKDGLKIRVGIGDTTAASVWRYECVPCKLKFHRRSYLQRHRHNVHKQKKLDFYCDVCDRSFKVKTLMEYHKLSHAPDWADLSSEEQKERKWDARQKVMEAKKYQCPHCDKKFEYEANFRNHCRTHTGERNYKCLTCGAAYMQPYTLQKHLQENKCEKKIMEEMSRSFQCDICKSCLKSAKGLYNHKSRYHGIRLPPRPTLHPCLFCSFVAVSSSNLINHNRSHTGDKPYPCEACGQRFAARHNLRVHVRLYCAKAKEQGLDKVIENEFLSNKAKLESSRQKKKSQQKDQGQINCPQCSEPYATQTLLNTHLRRHGTSFMCDYCPAGYKNQRSLFYHRASAHHQEIGGFSCHICSKIIVSRHSLRRHYRTVHLSDPPKELEVKRKKATNESTAAVLVNDGLNIIDPLVEIGIDRPDLQISPVLVEEDGEEEDEEFEMDDIMQVEEEDEEPEILMEIPRNSAYVKYYKNQPVIAASSTTSWIEENEDEEVKYDQTLQLHGGGYYSSKQLLNPAKVEDEESVEKTELDIIDIEPESGASILYSYRVLSSDN